MLYFVHSKIIITLRYDEEAVEGRRLPPSHEDSILASRDPLRPPLHQPPPPHRRRYTSTSPPPITSQPIASRARPSSPTFQRSMREGDPSHRRERDHYPSNPRDAFDREMRSDGGAFGRGDLRRDAFGREIGAAEGEIASFRGGSDPRAADDRRTVDYGHQRTSDERRTVDYGHQRSREIEPIHHHRDGHQHRSGSREHRDGIGRRDVRRPDEDRRRQSPPSSKDRWAPVSQLYFLG